MFWYALVMYEGLYRGQASLSIQNMSE